MAVRRTGVDTGRTALVLEPLSNERYLELAAEMGVATDDPNQGDELFEAFTSAVRAEARENAQMAFELGTLSRFNTVGSGVFSPSIGSAGISSGGGFLGTLGGLVGTADAIVDIYDRIRNNPSAAQEPIRGGGGGQQNAILSQDIPVERPDPVIIQMQDPLGRSSAARQGAGTIVQGSTRPSRGRWTPIVNQAGQVTAWRKLPNRMNVLNPDALRRSMRRVTGFAGFAKRAIVFTQTHRRPGRRRKR